MKNKLFARWGVLLKKMQDEFWIDKKGIHRALVKAKGKASLTELNEDQLEEFIYEIIGLLASENGVEVYFDKKDLSSLTLTELFEHYKKTGL